MLIEDARTQFSPDGVYLNTAAMGLPPQRSIDALRRVLDEWQRGRSVANDFDEAVQRSRVGFARLVGVDPSWVAVGPQVSVFTGLIAASLPAGAELLVPAGEFTSVTFPFQARGLTVREVPLEALAAEVRPQTALVAASLVQSADGQVLDLDAVLDVARVVGARVLLDLTQAAGWFPVDAARADYTVCGGYKFLLAPRGTAFLTVRPEHVESLTAVHASWYAGEDRWDSIYGLPLRLARSARRFDVSPAWHSWVGQAESLELLNEVSGDDRHAHAVALTGELARRLELPAPGSAILSVPLPEPGLEAVAARLDRARIAASVRAGRLRLSVHLYNTDEDIATAARTLQPG